MKAFGRIPLLAWFAVAIGLAQNAALLPPPVSQFFDNSGFPLAGGRVYTCLAGATCPGTPLASYTDSSAAVQNQNPVILDASGRANIWLSNTPYKIVVKDSAGTTITTTDFVQAGGFLNSGPWVVNNNTISNGGAIGSRVCIASTACTNALAQLNVAGTSSGTSYLIRIDDNGNSPGINLYGSGNSMGSYAADSAGLRLRAGSGASQMVVAQGGVTIQDASSAGVSTLTIKAGAGQGSSNFLQIQNGASTNIGWIDGSANHVAPLYNATAVGSLPTFQNSNNLFSVNGFGDVTGNGSLNMVGSVDAVNGDGAPYKVNGTTIVDKDRNATFATLTCTGSPCGSGGGGGGSPGGATKDVQFNLSGSFAGSTNFQWDNTAKLLTVTANNSSSAGIAVGTGYIQADAGFLATTGTATTYNAIQAPGGGLAGKSVTALNYIQAGNHSGAPTPTTGDTFNAGALYWDTGSSAMKVYDGGSWVTLATGGATSPGGSTTNVQYNSAGAFAGSGNFTWNNASRLLTVTAASSANPGIVVGTGYIQSDAGFLATIGTATNYNAIQAPGGGMAAKSFTATTYVQIGSGASNPTATTGDTINPGALYWNTTSSQTMVYNGSAWVALASGGGGGTPGGSSTNVQFNNSGSFGGSANFTWDNVARLLTVTTASSLNAGIVVGNGFIQSAAGFLATGGTSNNYNSIQAPTGGVSARSLTATTYIQAGNSFSTPTVTSGDAFHAGALFFNTSLGALQVFNGSTWVSLSSGGGGGVTSVAGTSNQVLVNGGTAAQTGAVTLSLPQAISTGSVPTFAAVIANGAFNSTVTGGSVGLQINGGQFQAFGNGNVNAGGNYNALGNYQIDGVTVINDSRQFVGTGVDVGSAGISAGNYNVVGGYIGQTWNIGFSSPFTINGGGSYSTLIFRGGILVSAFNIFGGPLQFLLMWALGLVFVAKRIIQAL